MAVWGEFGYKNLWSKAKDIKAFSDDVLVGVDDICREFATWDFEYIMRLLWQTSLVNNCLVISDDKTSRIYSEVRGGVDQGCSGYSPSFR